MNIDNFIVSDNMTVIEVMEVINANARGIAFVCNDGILEAVVTDGDIRRYILNKGGLNSPIKKIANYNPKYIVNYENTNIFEFMRLNFISAIPIVDEKKHIMSIQFLNDKKIYKNTNLNIPVVIMAGGKGTRLYPYTKILPKPLIPVGEKTITEYIMNRFENFHCNEFNMIVNYKKNLIKSFFTDSEIKRNVNFIEENEFMGTGGGLKLLEGKINSTFFMTNCDILIDADYSEILRYHNESKNIITIVCAVKNFVIPYGSIKLDEGGKVFGLEEKPKFTFMANTGLYVIEPEFLKYIPHNKFIHITDIIEKCIENNENVGTYPISENAWMDMGQLDELENMRRRIEKTI